MRIARNTKIALIILIILALTFGAVLTVYIISNQYNKNLYLNEKIRISAFDQLLGEYTFRELLEYTEAREFEAVYKPKNSVPINRTYTGIYLKDLIIALNVNINEISEVRFTAMDGMQKIYDVSDIMDEDNVFIAYLVNGKPFISGILSTAGNNGEEDGGPFVVIRAKDSVSQHRVKLLTEINIS